MFLKKEKAQTSIILFTVGMILTKLSSFLVNVALSYKYGASFVSDAIIISLNIPTIIFAGFISAISLCYVPLYKEIEATDPSSINQITSKFINFLAFVFAIACLILFLVSNLFIKLFAHGMVSEGVDLASKITKWVAVASLLTSTTGLLQGYLQANNKFRLVSISALPINIIIAVSILSSQQQYVDIYLGLGFLISHAVQYIMFLVESRKCGFKWEWSIGYRNEYLKKLLMMVLPVFISTLIYDINTIIDKSFASLLDSGNISVLDYAYKVAGAAQGILAYPLTTVIYTKLSEDSSKKDFSSLYDTINSGIRRLGFFMIPTITGLIVLSDLVINVLFLRGNFSSIAAEMTSKCLVLYLIGMFAISYRALFEKVLYSQQLTKLTLSNAVITVVFNIELNFILYRQFGSYGLATATSASVIVSLLYLYFLLAKKTGYRLSKATRRTVFNIVISALVMAICVLITKRYIIEQWLSINTINGAILVVLLSLEGALVYSLMLVALREKMIMSIIDIIRKRGKA